jgi:hypothetical protein
VKALTKGLFYLRLRLFGILAGKLDNIPPFSGQILFWGTYFKFVSARHRPHCDTRRRRIQEGARKSVRLSLTDVPSHRAKHQ